MSDNKQNEPMTKERLEESAVEMLPHRNSHDWQSMVTPTDALAHGDERYKAGLMEAAKALCGACAGTDTTVNAHPALLSFSSGTTWIHGKKRRVGNRTCAAGPIHDLVLRREEQADDK